MKAFIQIKILLFIIIHSQLQATPIPLSGSALNKIHFVNNQTGYIIGNDGKVFKTTNGGSSWDSITIIINSQTVTEHLTDIHFETEQKGYITGSNGKLFRTTNGGATWSSPDIGTSENINSITQITPGQYVIAGNNSTIIQFSDASGDWSTKFWYDHLGRIVASQNSKQHNYSPPAYSYTVYDALGRISETGEIQPTVPITGSVYQNNKYNDITYQLWVALGDKREVAKTFYDTPRYPILGFTQEHLRNRVSSVIYQDTFSTDNSHYDYASHYSYDIHGNVKTLIQDYKELAPFNQQYKQIDYQYDLISGKVNQLTYQANHPDQYIHKYHYDADNRITHVYTSRDNVNWDQDAKYYYYDHGPLARTEIGHNKVQATDYAYTLQGWLKGVNSNILQPKNDMGRDGFANHKHQYIAKDEVGFSLGYFENDYKAINQSNINEEDFFLSKTTGSQLQASTKPLYNGNINQMITSIREFMRGDRPDPKPPLAQAYQYDQLNRLIAANSFYDDNLPSANQWSDINTATNSFKERYKYDPNGNILNLDRYNATEIMDSFGYHYPTNRNRLRHVKDAIADGISTEDIDNQDDDNYAYDEIGNLIKDESDSIQTITWNVAGKIKSITRYDNTTKPDLEFRYDAMGHRVVKIVKPKIGSSAPYTLSNEDKWEYTYYIRDANGNTMATYSRNTTEANDTLTVAYKLQEHTIYGSSRLGVAASQLNAALVTLKFPDDVAYHNDGTYDLTSVLPIQITYTGNPNLKLHYLGKKQYELTNHLGNVLATVSDIKTPIEDNGDIVGFEADVRSAQLYYPYGALARKYQTSNYRYGFGAHEKDNEVSGVGNHYTAEFWEYSPRVVQRWNIDPVTKGWISPYAVFGNNPVYYNDPDGADWDVKKTEKEGKTNYDIKVTGAIYNNSGEKIDMESLQKKMVDQIKEVYGSAGDANTTVNINVNLRVVTDLKDVKSTDHLISIESNDNYDKYAGSEGKGTNAYADIGGLKIVMPYRTASGILEDNNLYHRTIAHELGHTGGLYHPNDFNSSVVQGVNKYDKSDKGNFMYSRGGKSIKVSQIQVIHNNYINQRINQQTQFINTKTREINYKHQKYVDWRDRLFGP